MEIIIITLYFAIKVGFEVSFEFILPRKTCKISISLPSLLNNIIILCCFDIVILCKFVCRHPFYLGIFLHLNLVDFYVDPFYNLYLLKQGYNFHKWFILIYQLVSSHTILNLQPSAIIHLIGRLNGSKGKKQGSKKNGQELESILYYTK